MSTNMSQPPPPSMPPSSGPPPPTEQGHGPFSEEEIEQMMAETGYTYEQVCQAIDQSGATTKEQVFPQFYSGQGIQPPAQTAGPGVAQEPPPVPSAPAPSAPAEAGPMQPGGAPPSGPAGIEGIDPAVAQQIHSALAPKKKPPMGPGSGSMR